MILGRAVSYLFAPDWSRIDAAVVLAAVAQAFASINVGFGAMLTLASRLPADIPVARVALTIAGADTFVALLGGMAIFPIVFAYGLDPGEGAGLVFVSLSSAFGQMPGGRLLGAAFFLLMSLAALTSTIAILDILVRRFEDTGKLSRGRAAALMGATTFVLGLVTILSFGPWAEVRPLGGRNLYELIDHIAINLMVPLGCVLYALFGGWVLSARFLSEETGIRGVPLQALRFVLRFVIPLAIGWILIQNLIGG